MFKTRLLVRAVLAMSAWLYAADQTTTLEGTLVSASCYLADKSATGNEMGGVKECGSGCLKQGKPGGLLTKDNEFHILDAPSLKLAPYVGQQIRVTGIEHKDILSVKSASAKRSGGWEEIDIRWHGKE